MNDPKKTASKILYEASKQTWQNRKGKIGEIFTPYDDFTGLRAINVGMLPQNTILCLGFDGIGTKIEIAERLQKHDTIAHDLFAMVCDDAVAKGGEPAIIGTILDVNNATKIEYIEQLAKGYVEAAKKANVAVINGEIAELGMRITGYGDFNYDWGAGAIWFANTQKMITCKEIKPGQKIVTLKENGFRSNGLTLARKIMQENYGNNWHEQKPEYAKQILTPSIIYTPAIVEMHGGINEPANVQITGIAHITGGGIPEKLSRTLKPTSLGAVLENLFEPPQIMQEIQQIGKVSDDDAYNNWNMGNGMLIITAEPEKAIAYAQKYGIDAKIAGEIISEEKITIKPAKNR